MYKLLLRLDIVNYQHFPFDLDKTVALADWVICYDVTNGEPNNKNNHIRFVNWSGQDVYI